MSKSCPCKTDESKKYSKIFSHTGSLCELLKRKFKNNLPKCQQPHVFVYPWIIVEENRSIMSTSMEEPFGMEKTKNVDLVVCIYGLIC